MKCTRKYSLFIAIYSILVSISQANDTIRELPGEHDDFEGIRALNKLYVDKSDYIKTLLESEDRFFCMCRPARFGKSNFLQMLDLYFRGRKESFAGLAIHEKHDWQTSYPVIFLDFASMDVTRLEKFSACLNREIVRIGNEYGVNMNDTLPLYPAVRQELEKLPNSEETKLGQLMGSLTKNWTQEQSVVVLIDEYDYPKRRNSHLYQRENFLSRIDSHLEMFLNPFFYELERMKRFIKFLFLTCTTKVSYRFVTKYPETPITVKDITFEDRFSKMIGLTGAEFEHHLKPHLTALTANLPNETFRTMVEKLRKRYNGYCFSRDGINNESDCRLFNFHSVMSFVRDKDPSFLWHPGADPKYNILNNVTSMTEFDELFDIFSNQSAAILTVPRKSLENPFVMLPGRPGELHKTKSRYSMRAFLVLYGYLTFRGYNEQTDEFVVDFPNDEMRDSYRRSLLRYFAGRETTTSDFTNTCKAIHKSMQSGTTESFVELINDELLKPNVGKNNDVHSFYRFSGNRIAHVLSACGALFPEAMIVRAFYREIIHRDVDNANSVIGFVEKIVCDVLVVRLVPSQITYTIKIEVERSAVSAIDAALKWVNAGNFRNASRGRTFQLMGINFNKEEDLLNDWIRMTYLNGRFMNVRASNSRNAKMYLTYANHLEPYSSLV